MTHDPPGKISLAEAVARVHAEPVPYALLFERGDLAVELFIPRGRDAQSPHDQDELHLIQSGAAILDRACSQEPRTVLSVRPNRTTAPLVHEPTQDRLDTIVHALLLRIRRWPVGKLAAFHSPC